MNVKGGENIMRKFSFEDWKRRRIFGMLDHVKGELIEELEKNPQDAASIINSVKRDPRAVKILEDNGVKLP